MISILIFVVGLGIGALGGGYIVKNNKDKAYAILDKIRVKAEEELTALKAATKK